jgi:NAD(P)-dependent dehydrogenase (short-subunit alcohol dehydrogenase family)
MTEKTNTLHQLLDLSGKCALITGGSRGLGLQMAEALGEFGAMTILTSRKQDDLNEAIKHLEGLGHKADAFACDISQPSHVARLLAWLIERKLSVDILVNNAGTTWGAPTEDHPLSGWQKVLDLNLTGTFLITQAIGKQWMIPARSGRIVNIASVAGLHGNHPDMMPTLAYNSSKGGLIAFTRALAAEWARHGITVNAIAPGFFPSRMTSHTLGEHGALLLQGTPRGELGGPEDLKGATLLFASDACAHMTGQVLTVDGGASII